MSINDNYWGQQLWKLNGTKLENKAGIWKSDANWTLPTVGAPGIIMNTITGGVFGFNETEVIEDGTEVVEEPLVENEPKQRWIKGPMNDKGYFQLTNSGSKKVLTAIHENGLSVEDPNWQKLHDESEIFLPTYVYAIIFAFGAFTDIVLITGATRKDNIGMYVWIIANLFFIGPICCLIIPFIITYESSVNKDKTKEKQQRKQLRRPKDKIIEI